MPPPWTSQDVGAPALSGQATYSAGTFTVTGAGIDIWDRTDQFRFVYQAIDGDAEIVARVDSLQNTDAWAKAGVMIREDLTGNAPNALASVTAANGISFQQRGTRGNMTRVYTRGTGGQGASMGPPGAQRHHLDRVLLRDRHHVDADRDGHDDAADPCVRWPGRDQSQPLCDLHGYLQQCHDASTESVATS